MDFFKNRLMVFAIIAAFVFTLYPLSAKGEEKTLIQETEEIDDNSEKALETYTINISSLGEDINLKIEDKTVGITPAHITVINGETFKLKGYDKKGDLIFETMIEGGITPENISIQTPVTETYSSKTAKVILGATAGFTLTFIGGFALILSLSGGFG